MFSRAEITSMRDRTAARNYSAAGEEFRREHERHRAWGLRRRYAEKMRRAERNVSASPAASAVRDDPGRPASTVAPLSAQRPPPSTTTSHRAPQSAAAAPGHASRSSSATPHGVESAVPRPTAGPVTPRRAEPRMAATPAIPHHPEWATPRPATMRATPRAAVGAAVAGGFSTIESGCGVMVVQVTLCADPCFRGRAALCAVVKVFKGGFRVISLPDFEESFPMPMPMPMPMPIWAAIGLERFMCRAPPLYTHLHGCRRARCGRYPSNLIVVAPVTNRRRAW